MASMQRHEVEPARCPCYARVKWRLLPACVLLLLGNNVFYNMTFMSDEAHDRQIECSIELLIKN